MNKAWKLFYALVLVLVGSLVFVNVNKILGAIIILAGMNELP